MPAIEPFYELNTDHAKRIDSAGDQERTARKAEIDLLWRYYDGDHDEMLIVRPGRKNDNVTINLVGQAADDTVDFVGVPERMELPGGDEVSNVAGELSRVVTTEQETVDAIYEDHRQLMRDAVLSLLLAGHAFAKVHITEDGPTFDLVDPRMVTVYVDAFNPRRVVFYRMQWTVEPAGRFGKEIALRQDIVPAWAITARRAGRRLVERRCAANGRPAREAQGVRVLWRRAAALRQQTERYVQPDDGQRGPHPVLARAPEDGIHRRAEGQHRHDLD
jgi:hypothetical protein